MSLSDGDVVRFDYTLWSGDDALDTSIEDKAQELGIHRPDKAYRPLTITLGQRQIIPGLERRLVDAKPGTPTTIDVPAAEAYGARDANKIKDVPMAQFRKQKVQPQVGMQLNYENQRATITRVAGGRVRLDMNHDLAGKDLRYEITVQKVITDRKDKVEAVLEGLFVGGAPFTLSDDTLELEVPDQAKFDREWPMAKFRVVNELKQAAGEPIKVRLVEEYPAFTPPTDEEE